MGKTVARRCFEDTSIEVVAKPWYEADVSGRNPEEKAGCHVQCGDSLRSLGLDSLADKTRARGLFCTLAAEHWRERRCLPNLLTIVGEERECFHCLVRMRVVLSAPKDGFTLVFRATQHDTHLMNATIRHHQTLSTS
jgi:hypothetical protein